MPFNEAQSRAVRHGKGPMMVLAGPGSGKTTVIVGRVRNLVENQGVSPSNILVITFTRAAAREMEERYLAYDMEQTGGRVSFGTFHSVFFRILKLAYQYDGGNIVREEQQVQFIREEMGRLSLDVEDEGEFIRSILSEISMVKGEMIPLEHYYAKNCSEEIFKQLYEAGYEIEKIRLIDEYDADDEKSMSDNNSSAFNFRYISYSTKLSKHALGLAVDINTLYNPYVKYVDGRRNVEPANAEKYTDRSIEFPHKIDHGDLCYKVFTEHGFEWGGDWEHAKDYQHFEMPDEWIEKSSCRKM